MGRVARRRQEEDDREKTLEPDRPYVNPISRSATTVMLGDKALAAYQKERTPYKLGRHRSKYDMEANFKPRSELSLLQDSNRYKPKNEYDPIRRKDTLYDAYSRNGRYNSNLNGNNLNHRSRAGLDSGYYDGGGKENTFKSKYDPDMIYSEINNNYLDQFNGSAALKERERKRAIRSYKRTDTSNDRRHTTTLFKDLDDETDIPSTSRFTNRKSYQRSQTQKFFDSENLYASNNNNHHADNGAAAEASNIVPNEALTEREARRKEIQGLIMKYAQLDDVYSKATEDQANNNVKRGEPFGLMPSTSSLAVPQKIGGFVPLSKTQTVAAMSSMRSRIPKALSTFVRFIH